MPRPFALKSCVPTFVGIALFVSIFSACQKPAEEAAPTVVERVENTELGLAIAALTPFFKVASNDGASIELIPSAADGTGRLEIVAGEPETGGINLVAAVEDHKARVLERPNGDYKGQREMISPMGTTFYSRGRYQGDEGEIEETIVFTIHPWGDRQLHLVYRYPAGEDTKERLQDQLFDVLGELEALPRPGEEASAE